MKWDVEKANPGVCVKLMTAVAIGMQFNWDPWETTHSMPSN